MSATHTAIQPPDISEQEWHLRQDLAACYRAFVHYGWTDLIFTHLSVRVPDARDQYIINPYGLLFQEITASNLIKVDFNGNVVQGDFPYNKAGHSIHSAVLKARPDVNVVLHSHTRAGMAVSCMECGLLPLTQQANEIMSLVSYHDYDVATNNEEECARLGQDIADKWLMIMHNHGLLSAGRNVAEAFYLLYTLENACKVQVDILGSGVEYKLPKRDAIKRLNQEGELSESGPDEYVVDAWHSVIRMLERVDPSFKN